MDGFTPTNAVSISAYLFLFLSITPGQKPPDESSKSRNKAGKNRPTKPITSFPTDVISTRPSFHDGGRGRGVEVVVKWGLEP